MKKDIDSGGNESIHAAPEQQRLSFMIGLKKLEDIANLTIINLVCGTALPATQVRRFVGSRLQGPTRDLTSMAFSGAGFCGAIYMATQHPNEALPVYVLNAAYELLKSNTPEYSGQPGKYGMP